MKVNIYDFVAHLGKKEKKKKKKKSLPTDPYFFGHVTRNKPNFFLGLSECIFNHEFVFVYNECF